MNNGKTYHWFKHAAENFPEADYVAKADMDSYIRTVYMESELTCCMPRKVSAHCSYASTLLT